MKDKPLMQVAQRATCCNFGPYLYICASKSGVLNCCIRGLTGHPKYLTSSSGSSGLSHAGHSSGGRSWHLQEFKNEVRQGSVGQVRVSLGVMKWRAKGVYWLKSSPWHSIFHLIALHTFPHIWPDDICALHSHSGERTESSVLVFSMVSVAFGSD